MSRLLFAFLTVLASVSVLTTHAQDTNSPMPETNSPILELRSFFDGVRTKVQQGSNTVESLSAELKQFDDYYTRYKSSHGDIAAEILFMKAKLHEEVFEDKESTEKIFAQIRKELPDSRLAQELKRQEEVNRIRAQLHPGAEFPPFEEQTHDGKPLSLASFRGKVVLVDFWATWCPPCLADMPATLYLHKKYNAAGFEVIGVNLDHDIATFKRFHDRFELPWPEYADGKGWGNRLAQKYGIQSLPTTFLLDKAGKIIGRDLRGPDLEAAIVKALEAK